MIDDLPADCTSINAALVRSGYKGRFETLTPFHTLDELLSSFPAPESFDSIDMCFVDLELLGSITPSSSRISEIAITGATHILPMIREVAPWMPVIAVSRYLRGPTFSNQPLIGCYPFDGIISKDAFSNSFHYDQWEDIVTLTKRNAKERCMQCTVTNKQGVNIFNESDANAIRDGFGSIWSEERKILRKEFIDEKYTSTVDIVSSAFQFAERFYITALEPGHSGERVFRVTTERRIEHGAGSANWVMKLSNRPSRLVKELRAYVEILRSGIDYFHLAPPLWPQVIATADCGLIAYRYAGSQGTAASVLKQQPVLDSVLKKLSVAIKGLYQNPVPRTEDFGSLLRKWFSKWKWSAVKLSGGGSWSNIDEFLNQPQFKIRTPGDCHMTLIHGDLHLGNILIGDLVTLIDFSRSTSGPLVLDLAKLATDLWIDYPSQFLAYIPEWAHCQQICEWQRFTATLLANPSEMDIIIFNAAAQIYLAAARDYYSSLKEADSRQRVNDALTLNDWHV